jgi:hypothetical protein
VAPIAWPHHSLDFTPVDSLTITIPGKTRCVLQHYICPLHKFIQVFKVVKLFLKDPVFDTSKLAYSIFVWEKNYVL